MKIKFTLFLALVCFVLVSNTISTTNLLNYENQTVPNYIPNNRDNTPNDNAITDEAATLGRVLFYDKNLSLNNTISCASCHKQELAFSDDATVSIGQNGGVTGRHSMRLVNARFAQEDSFFWDKRAATLEIQTTQPIQDHIEMGFSGQNGNPDIDSLIRKLENIDYYDQLFTLAFGNSTITEIQMQQAMAQFVRSIQSFDSKYDVGRAQVGNDNDDFPNFSASETRGKNLFMTRPNDNGAGCDACHQAPTFDIDEDRRNNGVIGVAGIPGAEDLNNTRSPSLRDIVNPDGSLNGPLMHDGSFTSLRQVIDHYNQVPNNANLDNRLNRGGGNLQLTEQEKLDLEAFLRTLTGSNIYTDERWSNPFDDNNTLVVINGICTDDENENVSANINNDTYTVSVSNSITSDCTVSNNATVIFQAGNSITLTADFTVEEGSIFSALIGDCTSNFNGEEIQTTAKRATIANNDNRLETDKMMIYPNPTTHLITIEIPSIMDLTNGQLVIFNATGRTILEQKLSSYSIKANLSNFPAGMYFVKAFDGEQQFMTKVLKVE